MINKKIASEIAVGIILLVAIAMGASVWVSRNSETNNKGQIARDREQAAGDQEQKFLNEQKEINKPLVQENKNTISKTYEELLKKDLEDIYNQKIVYEKGYKSNAEPYVAENLSDGFILWSIPYSKGATYSVRGFEDSYRIEKMDNILDSFFKAKSDSQILKLPSVYLGQAQANYEAKKVVLGKRNFVVYEDFGVEGGYFTRTYLTFDKKTNQIIIFGIALFDIDPSKISSIEKCGIGTDVNTKSISSPGCYKSNIQYPVETLEKISQIESLLSLI